MAGGWAGSGGWGDTSREGGGGWILVGEGGDREGEMRVAGGGWGGEEGWRVFFWERGRSIVGGSGARWCVVVEREGGKRVGCD